MAQISDKSIIVSAGAALTLGLGILGYNADNSHQERLRECLSQNTPEVCKPLEHKDSFPYTLAGFALLGTGATLVMMDGFRHPNDPREDD